MMDESFKRQPRLGSPGSLTVAAPSPLAITTTAVQPTTVNRTAAGTITSAPVTDDPSTSCAAATESQFSFLDGVVLLLYFAGVLAVGFRAFQVRLPQFLMVLYTDVDPLDGTEHWSYLPLTFLWHVCMNIGRKEGTVCCSSSQPRRLAILGRPRPVLPSRPQRPLVCGTLSAHVLYSPERGGDT